MQNNPAVQDLPPAITTRAFGLLFCLSFAVVMVAALVTGIWPILSLALAAGIVFAFFWLSRLIHTVEGRAIRPAPFALLLIAFTLQQLFAWQLAFEPAHDLGAVYHGAVQWATTGSLGEYQEYFHIFPNNLGSLMLLKTVFSCARFFGISEYYFLATQVNILFVQLAFGAVYLAARALAGPRQALFALALCVLYVPLYYFVPIAYSDTLSMPFPIIAFLLYVLARQHKRAWWGQLLLYAGMGLALGVGYSIKVTAAIMGVAIAIDILLCSARKVHLMCLGAAVGAFVLVLSLVDTAAYSSVLNREAAQEKNVPFTHGFMMGLGGNGRYNHADYLYTYSFSGQEARKAANITVIRQRVKALGPVGLAGLWIAKTAHAFGDGTYDAATFLDDAPVRNPRCTPWFCTLMKTNLLSSCTNHCARAYT